MEHWSRRTIMLNSIVAFQHSKKESSPQKKDFQSEQPFSFSAFSFSPQKEYKEKRGGGAGVGALQAYHVKV